jgi:glutamate racemase
MVGPTVSTFRGSDLRIALVATPATINSEIYQNAFRMIGKDIIALPIPGLAGAIEFGKSDEDIKSIIEEHLQNLDTNSIDVLVLACTHYPFATRVFKELLDKKIEIFDPALAVADRVERLLWPREVGNGETRFVLSAESPQFRHLVEEFFPDEEYEIEILA